MALRDSPRAGDDAVVHTDRIDLPQPEFPSFKGRTGRVIAVREDGDLLLRFKGHGNAVSFPRNYVGWRAND